MTRRKQVRPMPVYRCYFFDPQNHITDVAFVTQATDKLAQAEGFEWLTRTLCHAVEVFDGGRLICRLGKPTAKG
jgi:hypothetical protein